MREREVALPCCVGYAAGDREHRASVHALTEFQAGASSRPSRVHGGIGSTCEHPTHLYYKRAASDAALLGGRAAAADRLAAAVRD